MLTIELNGIDEVEQFEKIVKKINKLGVKKVFDIIKYSVDKDNKDTDNVYVINCHTLKINQEHER